MSFTVGMVVEGPHDFEMLTPLVRAELVAMGVVEPLTFRPLQPVPDETGAFGGGGWTRVVAWCQANSGGGLETFFEPLFAGENGCDVIVVHLDGDALELAVPLSSVVVPPGPVQIEQRVALVSAALREWLSPEPNRTDRLISAVPVLQTESWVIGANDDVKNAENLNSKDVFRSSFNRKLHVNMLSFYRSRSQVSSAGLTNLRRNSKSYPIFVEELRSAKLAVRG